MQCILSALVAIIIALAPVFNIPLTVVPPKGELPHESEPAPSELSVYDKVVGVDDSVFYISRPNTENLKTIYASDFGMDSDAQDNTDAFCRAIDYCRRNPGTRLVIDAGEYSFSPKNTIGLNSLKDVLIDAEGAVFVFDCDRYFEISGCENFEIKGLAVDWAWDESRLASVVKIEKRNAINHTFDMRFTELDEVPEDIAVMVMTQLDPRTLTFGAAGESKENYIYQHPEIIKSIEKVGKNVLRVTHDGSLDEFKNREYYLVRHYVYVSQVFSVCGASENITFDGVKIYSAAGMGWLFTQRVSRYQILNSSIGIRPGYEKTRHISATADGVHIADTNGHFRVSGCDFSYMGDDSLNVHDNLLYIKQRVSDNALTVYANQYLLTIGDTMKFKLGTYADIDFEAKITDISADGVISFDRTLPEEIAADTIMYIADCDSGNYVISNNYFHEHRARGLLLQSDNGLCENNRFYKIMGQQIKIVMDIMPGLWYEGTGVNNLVIRNNEFKLGCYSGWDSAIRIETNIAGSGAQVAAFSNITVESNRFINCENYILRADNVSGLNITNNKIINTRSIDGIDLRCGRIRLGDCCSAVKISGNRWNKTPLAPFGDIIALDHGLKAFL